MITTGDLARAQRLTRADQCEDEVADWLRERGWRVDLFGQRVWTATGSLVAASCHRLRHAPDLLAASESRVILVEAIEAPRPLPADGYRALMLAKLQACDAWSLLAPVLFIDWSNRLSWWHRPDWVHRCQGDVRARDRTGDHMPYVRVRRQHEAPLDLYTGIAP